MDVAIGAEHDIDHVAITSVGKPLARGLYACDLLGVGKRFETWLAWSTHHWCAVTVKLPQQAFVDDRRTRSALRHEAATVAPLVHPAVQRLLEDHTADPRPHLVYEYIEGPTLDDLLCDCARLGSGDVIRLGLQLAAALNYIHGQGVVHLDVKPANVALRDGRVVLLDFDISRRIGQRGTGRKPRGSPPFMAPEQIRCQPAAPSMDVFALGALLYEAATDRTAFEPSGEGRDRSYPQLDGPPPPPSSLAPDVSASLEHAIGRLLAGNPVERPPSAAAALALLAQALDPTDEALWPEWVTALLRS